MACTAASAPAQSAIPSATFSLMGLSWLLIHLDVGGADHLFPFRDFVFQEDREFRGAVADRLDADLDEAFADIGTIDDGHHFLPELRDDLARGVGRREESDPAARSVARHRRLA